MCGAYIFDAFLYKCLCLKKYTHDVRLAFEGEHFRQIDGEAMGSPSGSLLVDMWIV